MKVRPEDINKIKADWAKPIEMNEGFASKENSDEEIKEPDAKRFKVSAKLLAAPAEKSAVVVNEEQIAIPPQTLTGVSEIITVLCANVSQQIYEAKSAQDFVLGDDVDVLVFDDHGELNAALPAFCVAATQDTMVLAWRGTHLIMDMITDVALSPTTQSEWGRSKHVLRGQGMFSAFVGSDLALHQDTIIEYMKKKNTKTIVFTGHSLGAGLANLAHLFVRAQLDVENNNSSAWNSLRGVTCRALAFAPPMSMIDLDEMTPADLDKINVADKGKAENLIADLNTNTVNFVYGCDVVPRGYGHMDYLLDVLRAAGPEAVHMALQNYIPFGWFDGKLAGAAVDIFQRKLRNVILIATKYRHIGTLLYYPRGETTPKELRDEGPDPRRTRADNEFLFSSYSYKSYNIPNKQNIISLSNDHMFFPRHLASHISDPTVKS